MTQETQFYNICTLYGENTDGITMRTERMLYVQLLESKMKEVYDHYQNSMRNISHGILKPKSEEMPVAKADETPY